MAAILIIDDEPVLSHQLAAALSRSGHQVHTADTAAGGLELAESAQPDLVLLDLKLPDRSGIEIIEPLRSVDPSIQIVLVTAYGSLRDAVQAIRLGAADYLQKPLDMGELSVLIDRLLAKRRAENELQYHRERDPGLPDGLLQQDSRLSEALERVRRLCAPGAPAAHRPPILLQGEKGSGKAWIALALHRQLGHGPFLEVGAGEAEPAEVEELIFGIERSPSSPESRTGLVEAAQGGTLFVRDIERLPRRQQKRLLSVVSEHVVRRLHGRRDRETDLHLIASTTCDLSALVASGQFLSELYDRLSECPVEIPPLRECREQIGMLAEHFAQQLGRQYDGVPRRLAPAVIELFERYEWPGNLDELRNVIELAVLRSDAVELDEVHIGPLRVPRTNGDQAGFELPEVGIDLESVERDLLRQALMRAGGNQTRASALLGLSRDTLRYRAQKFGLIESNTSRC